MNHHWDEFSKSLAQRVPRRESLRRLGFVVAGAVLSPLGLESVWAGYRVWPPVRGGGDVFRGDMPGDLRWL